MSGDDEKVDWIELDGAANARAVVPGVLLRSDNLQSLTARDVRRLVDEHGLEAVVDLRTNVEVEGTGPGPIAAEGRVRVTVRSLYPDIAVSSDFDANTVRPWERHHDEDLPGEPPVVRAYMSYLRMRPDSIVGAASEIARARGSVLVHCAAGKDRTGVVVAIALGAAGFAPAAIAADYLASAERIDRIFARLLSSEVYRAELEGHDAGDHAPVAGTMERVLELIDERHGGPAAWLSANGLGEEDLRLLRLRLTGGPAL